MSTSHENRDGLIETLKALRAMSENPTNENEAATAAAQMQKLLLKHNLDMAELESTDEGCDDPMIRDFAYFHQYTRRGKAKRVKSPSRWKIVLADGVARGNFCKLVLEKQRQDGKWVQGMHILGRRANVRATGWMFQTIEADLIALSYDHEREIGRRPQSYWNAWFLGAARAIYNRLVTEKDAFASQSSECRDLVRVRSHEVDKYMQDEFGKLRNARAGRSPTDWGAYCEGRRAGRSMELKIWTVDFFGLPCRSYQRLITL